MEKEIFSESLCEVSIEELPFLFGHAFSKENNQTHPIISTFKWRIHSSGFKLHPTVINVDRNNPRKTGLWKFVVPNNFNRRWVAVEYFKCVSCENCPAKLCLKYKDNKCNIKGNSKSHKLIPSNKSTLRNPVPQQIRSEIIEMRNYSIIKMKPAHVHANLVRKYPQSLIPPPSQVNDIIEYEDKVMRSKTRVLCCTLILFITTCSKMIL